MACRQALSNRSKHLICKLIKSKQSSTPLEKSLDSSNAENEKDCRKHSLTTLNILCFYLAARVELKQLSFSAEFLFGASFYINQL